MPLIVNRHYISISNSVSLDNHLIQLNSYYTCNEYTTIITFEYVKYLFLT